jgi:hypothetical protein
MAPVGALESLDHFSAAGLDITPLALQRLNRGLLVNAHDQCLFRWVQIEADDICGFGRELGVRVDTPGTMSLQLDTFPTQHAPHRVV